MLILKFVGKITPEANPGIYNRTIEHRYEITKDSPQIFILPKPSVFNSVCVSDGVKFKPLAMDFFYLKPSFWNNDLCVRTDVYPLLWVFYAFVVFLDKRNLKLKKVVYKFLLWTKQGKDFLPVGERVSGWREFFKFYLSSLGEK